MDGYAIRLRKQRRLTICGESIPGTAPPQMPSRGCVRIFTGSPVPDGAEAVVPREQVEEQPSHILLPPNLTVSPGQFIRRRGESSSRGDTILPLGRLVTPAVATALATFGISRPTVYRRVRVAVITTGGEVADVDEQPSPWQVRDANAAAAAAVLATPWLDVQPARRVVDDRSRLADICAEQLRQCDALIVTGGVSMGDHDHTPGALADAGCRQLYHKLLMRPGKPNFGAAGPRGQLVLGLPGNPQSVLTGLRRLAMPALRRSAGFDQPEPPRTMVRLDPQGDDRTLGMWWYRPVRLVEDDLAVLVDSVSSGDTSGPASADGMIEVPPDAPPAGRFAYLPW